MALHSKVTFSINQIQLKIHFLGNVTKEMYLFEGGGTPQKVSISNFGVDAVWEKVVPLLSN
ncbi:MAG: hypothetical protein DSY94_08980 [SAR324 cluster bacterium]|uniref:Uncharacterized protein n=1 Tax=SAR324 cluster bacterium TaxID=2024889 RepID=A0A432GH84_9DELT|nr:MAG: hypothetical protein DSY94_08980 [SAR324 cluster bacterium]